jgi:hypothetical protein
MSWQVIVRRESSLPVYFQYGVKLFLFVGDVLWLSRVEMAHTDAIS